MSRSQKERVKTAIREMRESYGQAVADKAEGAASRAASLTGHATVPDASKKRTWRLGIDVGGTNTDAVIIDGDLNLVAATKRPTTEDVMGGIVAAMHEVITQIGAEAAQNIGFRYAGHHALHERHRRAQAPQQGGRAARGRAGHDGHQLHGRLARRAEGRHARARLFGARRQRVRRSRDQRAVRGRDPRGGARRARRGLRVRGGDQRVFAGVRRAREARGRGAARRAGRGFPRYAIVGNRVAWLSRARRTPPF